MDPSYQLLSLLAYLTFNKAVLMLPMGQHSTDGRDAAVNKAERDTWGGTAPWRRWCSNWDQNDEQEPPAVRKC